MPMENTMAEPFLNPPISPTQLRDPALQTPHGQLADVGAWAPQALDWLGALLGLGSTAKGVTALPAIMAGPAKYLTRRANPKLYKWLDKRPEIIYSQFEGPDALLTLPGEPRSAGEVVGRTYQMTPERARGLTVMNKVLEGLRIPTIQSLKGTSEHAIRKLQGGQPEGIRPLYKPLPRDLREGDIEIVHSKKYNPNEPGPGKSRELLTSQRETATHEPLHAAWVLKGKQGNPPVAPEKLEDVLRWSFRDEKVDPLMAMLAQLTPGHIFLTAAAKNSADRLRAREREQRLRTRRPGGLPR